VIRGVKSVVTTGVIGLKRGVADQARRFEACLRAFARQAFGRAGPAQLRRATFVLAEVPIAAVKHHLQRREPLSTALLLTPPQPTIA
jgi:hypothetical protein